MGQTKLSFGVIAILLAVTILWFGSLALAAQSQSADDEDDTLEQRLPPGISVRAFIHRPRVVEHNHLGTCTETTNDNINDFGLTGWHLPANITWKLNQSSVPATITAALAESTIQSSFATWSKLAGTSFIDDGSTSVKNTRLDGTNAVLWKRLGASTIGVTYVWYYTSTGDVAEVDTAFNSRYPWRVFTDGGDCSVQYDAYDLQNIATHEIGHWVGLEDLYDTADKDLTMYGFGAGGELKKRSLGTGDVSGAQAVAP